MEGHTRCVLSNHARDRAGEMGVPTKRVKAVMREPELRIDRNGEIKCFGDGLVVPCSMSGGRLVARTVLWRSDKPYEREEQASG